MNLLDICLIIILILVFAGAVFMWVSNRRSGKGCQGGCGGCVMRSSCGRRDTHAADIDTHK